MSKLPIRLPTRTLDEFEELVYEYTRRIGWGNKDVSYPNSRIAHRIKGVLIYTALTCHSLLALGYRRPQLQSPLRVRNSQPYTQGFLPHNHHPGAKQFYGQPAWWLRCDPD